MVTTRSKTSKDILETERRTPKSFTRFPKLPPELRLKIWHAFLDTPGSDVGVCILKCFTSENDTRNEELSVRPVYTPLLRTSKEARDVAQQVLSSRPYNPAADILYVSGNELNHFFGRCGTEDSTAVWTREVRHLALPLHVSTGGDSLPYALKTLDSLESFSIVVPNALGSVDVHEQVKIPSDPEKPRLRKLTDKEAGALQVSADYKYYGWWGTDHIKWTSTVDKYMLNVEAELCGRVKETMGPNPTFWNPRTKKLDLKFETRCFG